MGMRNKKRLFLILLLIVFIVSFIAYRAKGSQSVPELVLGFSQEAPYAFINKNGLMSGVFVEAATHIMLELPVLSHQWELVKFHRLLNDIKGGRISVIAAGMSVSEERAEKVCFAEPILQAKSALLTLKQEKLSGANALSPLKYIALAGYVEHSQLKASLAKEQMVLVERVSEGVSLLRSHKADAMVLSLPSLLNITAKYPNEFLIKDNIFTPDFVHLSAFAMDDDYQYLLSDWNRAQRQLAATPVFSEKAESLGFSIPVLPETILSRCYAR